MRKYNFEEYKKQLKIKYYRNFELLETERTISRRPRKEEDIKLLIAMSQARRKHWLETGKLKIIGERKYRLEI
ncbi:MAG: hypothetical protein ABII74_09275 [Elusimicrobiota bacterium]